MSPPGRPKGEYRSAQHEGTPMSLLRAALSCAGVAAALVACAGAPPPPDWQLNAHAALEQALAAHLSGNDRAAAQEFERARGQIARTGRVDLMARAELSRCAAQVASLRFEACAGFERLRADAPAAEQAYADYLLGALEPARRTLLPLQHQAAAAGADPALLHAVADPLTRLVAAALWLQAGQASPALLALAVDTASAQGWRRPLLAWLGVQLRRAEQAGDAAEAQRLARRIALVTLAGAPAR